LEAYINRSSIDGGEAYPYEKVSPVPVDLEDLHVIGALLTLLSTDASSGATREERRA
jgi:hypothetical protein